LTPGAAALHITAVCSLRSSDSPEQEGIMVPESVETPRATRWARLRDNVRRCELRRGAWYPVVSLAPGGAVIWLRQSTATVPLAFLELVRTRPIRWTLVPRERYAVCPCCAERVAIAHPPERMRCGRCEGEFAVA